MLESLTKKQKLIFFIIISVMLLIIIYYVYSTLYKNNLSFSYEDNDIVINNLLTNDVNNISSRNNSEYTIVVYICGAVKESKVISLKENSRICDAIDAVGGLTDEADLTNINLAYILEDGEKIYIPKIGEEVQNKAITSYNNSSNSNNKININKASQTELETIPGVGPSTALKIINYRKENGNFSKIDDIKNVSGIGDSKFNNIKNYITVK